MINQSSTGTRYILNLYIILKKIDLGFTLLDKAADREMVLF